jgi:hypothetical protein
VDGFEFGVFYYRRPGESQGHIVSITEKRFPCVTGDGKRTVAQLILGDKRAVCLANTYLACSRRPVDQVPAQGESVSLGEIGSHCRGSVFVDGSRFKTPALEEAIDRISHTHPGFFFGRYDIRTPCLQELQEGRGFKVIELNGVSAEATHIYDPAVSLLEAYRVLFHQWRLAFEIGAMNQKRGVWPMPAMDLWKLIWIRLRGTKSAVAPLISEPVQEAN